MSVALERYSNRDRLPPVLRTEQEGASATKLKEYICTMERACEEDPESADLRTCLGLAHALNQDVSKSIATLEQAIALDQNHFFARMKYAEMLFNLRALQRAEAETRKALQLAHNGWEFSMARRLFERIRAHMPDRKTPVRRGLAAVSVMILLLCCIAAIASK